MPLACPLPPSPSHIRFPSQMSSTFLRCDFMNSTTRWISLSSWKDLTLIEDMTSRYHSLQPLSLHFLFLPSSHPLPFFFFFEYSPPSSSSVRSPPPFRVFLVLFLCLILLLILLSSFLHLHDLVFLDENPLLTPHQLFYARHAERYAAFKHKIVHFVADDSMQLKFVTQEQAKDAIWNIEVQMRTGLV